MDRRERSTSLRNVYFIAGIWGDFRAGENPPTVSPEATVSDVLESWGVRQVPWLPCDGGVDLESAGPQVLRAWAHVDIRDVEGGASDDVPVRALLHGIWAALELYGTVTLTGIDASVPTVQAGDSLARRTAIAPVHPARAASAPRDAYVHISSAVPNRREAWQPERIAETMSITTPTRVAGERSVPPSPSQPIDHPLMSDDNGFVVATNLREWAIEDAGWLAEVAANACHESGVEQDVLIRVRAEE